MDPRKYQVMIVFSLLLLLSTATGCSAINKLMGRSSGQTGQKGSQQKNKIAVMLAPGQENLAQIKQGLQDAAKKEGAQITFLDNQDAGKQLTEQSKNFKALIVQASNSAGQQVPKDIKMPVVTIGQVSGFKPEAVVIPDYVHIGELQGEFLKSKLKEGNIILLQSSEPGAEEVVAGNKSSLASSPGLKIVQSFNSPAKNYSPVPAFAEYLKQNAGKVQAVLATDSKLALAAIESLKSFNLDKKVLVVGAGTDKQAVDKIVSGELSADVDTSPYLQGLYAFKLASLLGRKQSIDADRTVLTDAGETPAKMVPVHLVRTENVAKYQQMYAQPQEESTSAQGQNKQGSDSSQQSSGEQQSGQGQQSQSQGQQGQQSAQGQAAAQSGVVKIRERIRTETTREMLGADGKVIGTESDVREEVRTLPAPLLDATKKQQQGQSQSQDQQSKSSSGSQDKQQSKQSSDQQSQ